MKSIGDKLNSVLILRSRLERLRHNSSAIRSTLNVSSFVGIDDFDDFVHELFVFFAHLHILYGEERPFGESLAFFLSVIEEGQDLCLQIIVGERFLDIGFGTYLQSL